MFATSRLGISNPHHTPIKSQPSQIPPTLPDITAPNPFTPEEEAEFADDDLFGEDNGQAALKLYTRQLTAEQTNFSHRESRPKPKQAAWIQRDFRKRVNHDTPRTDNAHVTFNDESSDRKRSRQAWIRHQAKREATIRRNHPQGWNQRIPHHEQQQDCHLKSHGVDQPRKKTRYTYGTSANTLATTKARVKAKETKQEADEYKKRVHEHSGYTSNKSQKPITAKRTVLAASSATAEDEAKAAELKKQGITPVQLPKTPYRTKEKSVYT
jgi:hypothetical protein